MDTDTLRMDAPTESDSGCGSGSCGCGAATAAAPEAWHDTPLPDVTAPPVVRVNGRRIAVQAHDDLASVRERTWAEVLRQEAVRQGVLADVPGSDAPEVDADSQAVIEAWLDAAITTPEPSDEACARYYQAHPARFRHGQAARLRHILFAVTPGVPVQALAQRAETALLSLTDAEAPAARFAGLARELSNCPSGAEGGELGWVTPQDCAPELAQFLFFQEGGVAHGLQPRLVHSRHGLHIVDVQEQRAGELAPLGQVQARIAAELALQSRATAWRQYMLLLVGQAKVEGLALEGADTPLVQ